MPHVVINYLVNMGHFTLYLIKWLDGLGYRNPRNGIDFQDYLVVAFAQGHILAPVFNGYSVSSNQPYCFARKKDFVGDIALFGFAVGFDDIVHIT